MTRSFSIQFHATPSELAAFVREWCDEHPSVNVAAVWYHPFTVRCISAAGVGEALQNGARRLVFSEQPIAPDVRGNTELLDKNPGVLILEAGRLTDAGLNESHLSTKEATPQWKDIASRLKKVTRAGATAVNEATGASVRSKSRRYTDGAVGLWKAGRRMLTVGASVLRFD